MEIVCFALLLMESTVRGVAVGKRGSTSEMDNHSLIISILLTVLTLASGLVGWMMKQLRSELVDSIRSATELFKNVNDKIDQLEHQTRVALEECVSVKQCQACRENCLDGRKVTGSMAEQRIAHLETKFLAHYHDTEGIVVAIRRK